MVTFDDLFGSPYVFVDFYDDKGNSWCHKTDTPEETLRYVEASIPGVKGEIRVGKVRRK